MQKDVQEILAGLIDKHKGWESLSAADWVVLLCASHEYVAKCDAVDGWRLFTSNSWFELLKNEPDYEDEIVKHGGWDALDEYDWLALLKEYPQFSDRCDKNNGLATFQSHQWVRLLQKHPQFFVECDANGCWQRFNGFDWVELLRVQPQFADRCDKYNGWSTLVFEVNNGDGEVVVAGCWAELLELQPQFAEKCEQLNGWESFDGFDWYVLLSAQPSFVTKCSELGGWEDMFNFRPKEICHSEEADEFGACDNWSEYYYEEPLSNATAEYGNTFLRGERIATKPRPNGQSVLPVYCWMRPEYCKVCRSQKELDDEENWKNDMVKSLEKTLDSRQNNLSNAVINAVLKSQPSPDPYNIDPQGNIGHYRRGVLSELEVREIAAKLPKNFWVYFLNQNPRAALVFAEKYGVGNVWELFTIDDWKVAIENRTDFVNEIYSFEGRDDFADALLSAWPDFFDHLGYLPKEDSLRPDSEAQVVKCQVWPFLIRHRPDLAVHMNWNDWERLSEHDWRCLLHPRWHYIERAIVPIDERFWWLCLSKAPQFAMFCEQHGGWSKLSNYYLCDLIDKHSDLVEYCVKHLKWDELTSGDWRVLLSAQPQLADHCDAHNGWRSLVEEDWMRLISRQPHFAAKYTEIYSAQVPDERSEVKSC